MREYRRFQCKSCLLNARRKRTTSSPYNFIQRSFSQLKSARLGQSMEWSLELKDLFDLYDKQDGKCALTNEVMTYQVTGDGQGHLGNDSNISLDRIDDNKGYTLDNVQYVCKRINIMRHKSTVEEFKEWCEKVSQTNK